VSEAGKDRRTKAEREQDAAKQRQQEKQRQKEEVEQGTQFSPPPFEAPETPLERLDAGLGYLFAWVGGALLVNFLVLVLIAASAGG